MAERKYVKMKRTKKTPESVIEILGIPVEGKEIIEVPKADVKEFQKWGFKLVKEGNKDEEGKEDKKDKEDKQDKKEEKE